MWKYEAPHSIKHIMCFRLWIEGVECPGSGSHKQVIETSGSSGTGKK
jgi:hypothetical protein